MIAQIIPIKRLPQQVSFFDYSVPLELQERIQKGQLVRIPMRQSQSFGIVLSYTEESQSAHTLRDIDSIVHETPFVSERALHMSQIIARWYHMSLGTLLQWQMLPMQKRKLKKIDLLPFPHYAEKKNPRITRQRYTNPEIHQEQLCSSLALEGQTLILVPRQYLLKEVFQSLPEELQEQSVYWHSELSQKEKFASWIAIRNQEKKIIIGTRGSVLLPFPNLQSIILDYAHDREHKHWDQHPRFYVRDIATLWQKIYGCDVHIMSYSLPFQDEKETKEEQPKENILVAEPTIVDMRSHKQAEHNACISVALEQALRETKGDAFLWLNRKGFARQLLCLRCGHIPRCTRCDLAMHYHERFDQLRCHYCRMQRNKPKSCPSCQEAKLEYAGFGTEFVEQYLQHLFAHDLNTKIIRIDANTTKEAPLFEHDKRHIIIGTSAAYPYLDWTKISLTAFLDIDMALSRPLYHAVESTWHSIKQIQYYTTPSSQFFVQTRNPEHPLFQNLNTKNVLIEKELQQRKRLSYPPSSYLVRYTYRHKQRQSAIDHVKKMQNSLQKLLQRPEIAEKQGKRIQISDIFDLYPCYYRGQYHYSFLIYIDPDSWYNDLIWLNKFIPATWKVDPHPIDILAP